MNEDYESIDEDDYDDGWYDWDDEDDWENGDEDDLDDSPEAYLPHTVIGFVNSRDQNPKGNPTPNTEKKNMTKEYIPHISTKDSMTVFLNGVHQIPSNHLYYRDIVQAVKDGDKTSLVDLLNPKKRNGLEVLDDEVLWNGEPLHGVAVERLFEMEREGFDTQPMIKFLENCQKNPFPAVVARLYEFISTRGMPITEDGCFLAYKYCNKDYFDTHTGRAYKFLPNTHVKALNAENKGKICDLGGQECSGEGIHVGNFEYSGGMNRETHNVLYVKVNPCNVLSVPHGSDAKKVRVWELDVLGHVDGIHEGVVVTAEGESIEYVKGQAFEGHYKAENGVVLYLEGNILNVGKVYLELEEGYFSSVLKDGIYEDYTYGEVKRRLKISNIMKDQDV